LPFRQRMRIASVLLLLALFASACDRGSRNDGKSTGRSAARTAGRDTTRKALYPETDAVAIMRALDTAEIATSEIARDATQNDAVRSYAIVMIKDHRDIMHLVDSVGVAGRDNAISAKIRRDADSIARGLANIAVGLNNTYIEEQVKAHQQALQLLDTAIIPSAQNPQLKTLLTQLRPTILAHYQRAVQILAARHKDAEERGEAWTSGLQARPVQPTPVTTPQQPATPQFQRDTTVPPPLTTTSQ
jgi:putative membrane protein